MGSQEGTFSTLRHFEVTGMQSAERILPFEPPVDGKVSHESCFARDVLDRVGDKWSVFVIGLLGDGPRRFTELLRTIDGISQRMLTVTLRGLERDGLVSRKVHAVVPPRVDYA